jgi:hypothetical protein
LAKFLFAQLSMPVGAVLAVWFVMVMTKSQLSDLGGPVDLIVFLGIARQGRLAWRSSSTRLQAVHEMMMQRGQ